MSTTNRFMNLMNRLSNTACKSHIVHKHGAVLMHGNQPVAWGFNSIKGCYTQHAECEAIKQYLNRRGVIRWQTKQCLLCR